MKAAFTWRRKLITHVSTIRRLFLVWFNYFSRLSRVSKSADWTRRLFCLDPSSIHQPSLQLVDDLVDQSFAIVDFWQAENFFRLGKKNEIFKRSWGPPKTRALPSAARLDLIATSFSYATSTDDGRWLALFTLLVVDYQHKVVPSSIKCAISFSAETNNGHYDQ